MSDRRNGALGAIIGRDTQLQAVLARAALVAPTSVPVLVTGESGTGKELLARALHQLGPAPKGPFVAVNCSALPRELAESELFGHERGAFTGAATRRVGWFEEAAGGTLVLDEIGELPLDLQPKLLRALESGRIRRLGGAGETPLSVRVVAMTLRNLAGEAQRGSFRTDLYYRLAGFELALPALRQRRGDIPLLAQHFLEEIAAEVGARQLEPSAIAALQAAEWPGNVRQLRNVIRRAAILTGARIDAAALELPPPPPFRIADEPLRVRLADVDPLSSGVEMTRPRCLTASDGDTEPSADAFASSRCAGATSRHVAAPSEDAGDQVTLANRSFAEIEQLVLAWALRRNGGSRRRAARALSIARSTFCDKVRRYRLVVGRAPPDPAGRY